MEGAYFFTGGPLQCITVPSLDLLPCHLTWDLLNGSFCSFLRSFPIAQDLRTLGWTYVLMGAQAEGMAHQGPQAQKGV